MLNSLFNMRWWLLQRIIYLTLLLSIVIIGALNYKYLKLYLKFLLFVVATTFLFEALAIVVAYKPPPLNNNSWVYELASPIQLCLMIGLYYDLYQEKKTKKICLICFVAVLSIIAYEFFYLNYAKSNINIVSRSICYFFLSLLLLYEWIKKPDEQTKTKEPAFWINNGVLLFYTINILFWCIYKTKYFDVYNLNKVFKPLLYYSNLIFYTFCLFSFILFRKIIQNARG